MGNEVGKDTPAARIIAEEERLYGQVQVKSHEMSIGMYQSYAQTGTNPALRAHAEQALPVLQQHYQMAQRLPGAR